MAEAGSALPKSRPGTYRDGYLLLGSLLCALWDRSWVRGSFLYSYLITVPFD